MKVEIKIPEHTIINADDAGVTISRKGLRNLANRGTLGSTEIPYWAIASITYRKATLFLGGKFEINTIDKSSHHNGGLGGLDPAFAFSAYGSSTAIPFRNNKNKEMDQLKDFVQERINTAHNPKLQNNQTHNDSFDEKLRKLKSLLDDGIITQEEFDTKKKQLLDL